MIIPLFIMPTGQVRKSASFPAVYTPVDPVVLMRGGGVAFDVTFLNADGSVRYAGPGSEMNRETTQVCLGAIVAGKYGGIVLFSGQTDTLPSPDGCFRIRVGLNDPAIHDLFGEERLPDTLTRLHIVRLTLEVGWTIDPTTSDWSVAQSIPALLNNSILRPPGVGVFPPVTVKTEDEESSSTTEEACVGSD